MLRTCYLIVFLIALSNAALNGPSVLLLSGPSGFGKTSFLNQFSGFNTNVKIGNTGGMGDTITVKGYDIIKDSYPFTVFDVPGFNDPQMRVTNEEIMLMISEKLADREISSIGGILLFESLSEVRTNLADNLLELENYFGEKILKSIIVVFTRENLMTDPGRKKIVEAICTSRGLPFVYWLDHKSVTTKLSGAPTYSNTVDAVQGKNLLQTIKKVSSFSTKGILEIKYLIYAKALKAFEASWKNRNIKIVERSPTNYYLSETIRIQNNPWWKIPVGLGLAAVKTCGAFTGPVGWAFTATVVIVLSWAGYEFLRGDYTVTTHGWITNDELEPFITQAKEKFVKDAREKMKLRMATLKNNSEL